MTSDDGRPSSGDEPRNQPLSPGTTADAVKEIFGDACDRPPGERDTFLQSRCGDDAKLRRSVDELLKAHDEAGSFFAGPTRAAQPDGDALAAVGQWIGRYKLLQLIGEGGFGTVYMAGQEQPVRRRVALKIIKPGMDTKQVVARFEAERQALTMMDHPNIAKVLDAGTTDAGRPYFVMELVKGIPITDYCDQAQLNTRERLELFMQVCHAVQHAHQKGVIHRDLKPNNVMVTLHDDKPVPKVIDFGIAKAAGQLLTDKTLFTNYAQMLGTPLYMSPEQAQISGLDVDTRSDVYSLGVLLYELLTGTTPFDQKRLREAAYDEMRRIIREEEPPNPSTRLSTMGEQITLISTHRSTDPKHLSQLVHGELDWIVMKTLEKDRTRRYETANELARDVERHLLDEAVHACPPSNYYRFRKFARRNKRAVLTASAVAAALLLAVVILAVSNARITSEKNQKDLALREREAAFHEKEGALKDKGVALDSARASERDAKSQEGLARRRFYAAQMNLAMQAWEAGQPARMLQLLESQRPRFDQDDLRGFDWYYLWRLCQGARGVSLPTRNYDNSSAIAISPDGKMLASGYGHTVRLWDVSTGREVGELLGHNNMVGWLAFAPDGKTLASTDQVETMKVWDLATRKEAAVVKPGQAVRGLQFTGDSRILALAGTSVQLWDVVANREICKVGEFGKERVGLEVAVAPSGNIVAVCGSAEVRIWIREGSAWREAPRLHGDYYRCAAISPDGKLLAIGGGSLKLYDLPSRQERMSFEGHTGAVFGIAFAGDGKRLASGGQDRTVRMWDVATGKQQACIANPGPVYGVALAPDASVVAAMGTDAIRVWDVAPPAPAMVLHHAAPVHAVAFSPDGKTLASDGKDGTKLWDPANGREIATLGAVPPPYKWSSGLAFSPDGKSLATSGVAEGTIDIWEVTGRRLAVLTTGARVRRLAFSPNGKSLAEASVDFLVPSPPPAVWDLASQQRRLTLPVSKVASAVAYSPDGKTIAVGAQFGVVKLFDAQSGRELTTLQRFVLAVDWIEALAFSPDGRKLATGNEQGVVHIWDVATNHLETTLIGHTDAVASLAFGDGGRTLATASADRTIRLWDVATGQERITLKGHEGKVTCVAFAPDGNALATSSEDGTVRLWPAAVDAGARARKREVDPDDVKSPAADNERGDRLWQYGRVDEAEAAYRQAMDRLEKLRVAFPDDPACAQEMVRSLLSVSLLLRVERDPHPEAEPARLRARAIYRTLSPEDQAATFWAYSERHRNIYDTGNTSQQVDRTFSQMIELIPEDDVEWLTRAARYLTNCADAKLRDLPRAVELVQQAVAIATHSSNSPNDQNALAWELATNPDPNLRNPKTAVELAEKAVAAQPADGNIWNTLGVAQYRAGNWQAAVTALNKSMELRHGGDASDWYFLAMASQQLGQTDVARKWYDQSVRWAEQNSASLKTNLGQSNELRRFRDEAELLIRPTAQPGFAEPRPSTTAPLLNSGKPVAK